ncbi:MAG: butyrate kinase [Treponema sp.]|nr:butyrate kinase [Treponema sp.]
MSFKILAINPGSTSTKIAVYNDENPAFVKSIEHPIDELSKFNSLFEQFDIRMKYVLQAIEENGVKPIELSAVVGRGGLLSPLKPGGYLVNQAMVDALGSPDTRAHESNLGAPIAYSIARPLGIPAYIYDAVGSDELNDVARITGIPEIIRESFCHVLNTKATSRKVAEKLGSTYESMNFIVAHIGGGISISAHEKGRIIDVITADAGPFSPERSGSVPLGYIVDICYSGEYKTKKELMTKLNKNSGLKGLLGTNDCREIERRIASRDKKAKAVYDAQAYQIAKGIGEMTPPLCGIVDAVILTGGMAHSEYITKEVTRLVGYLGKVVVMPGENEMEALSLGALRILKGEEGYSEYGV